MTELVYKGANNQAVTNSLMVAEKFEKQHKTVIRCIDNILKGTSQNCAVLSMFEKSTYYNSQNKEQPMYLMNRDGFTLLTMGFTGKEALSFKLAYIDAFNKMEKHIKEEQQPRQLSQSEVLLQSVQLLVDIEHRQKDNEERTLALEQKMNEYEERQRNAELELFDTPLSNNEVPSITLRTQINNLVRKYAEARDIEYRIAWRQVYDEMQMRYHVIFSENKEKGVRKIDEVERRGFLQQMHDVISYLIRGRNAGN